jgi:hypothetical protein
MTRQAFLQLSVSEQNIFLSKLIHAARNNDTCFSYASFVVGAAEDEGLFSSVKFGNAVFEEVFKQNKN